MKLGFKLLRVQTRKDMIVINKQILSFVIEMRTLLQKMYGIINFVRSTTFANSILPRDSGNTMQALFYFKKTRAKSKSFRIHAITRLPRYLYKLLSMLQACWLQLVTCVIRRRPVMKCEEWVSPKWRYCHLTESEEKWKSQLYVCQRYMKQTKT